MVMTSGTNHVKSLVTAQEPSLKGLAKMVLNLTVPKTATKNFQLIKSISGLMALRTMHMKLFILKKLPPMRMSIGIVAIPLLASVKQIESPMMQL